MERRKHARAPVDARYKRLRREIEPPPAVLDAGYETFGWLARIARRVRALFRTSRKPGDAGAADRKPA